ncbi:hypothetical protein DPMN_044683 [Dreissena polymorpha]|uniref:Uncharacterized protein n=1 Tax=Dreissena polymorpha TaxID=45954 RepID=A0A9D4D2V8_DREPO|nr:hypothetical protein DPMN_044683 [Dreissena polymorpha]
MSLLIWLKTGPTPTSSPSVPGLPGPANSASQKEAVTTQAANDAVEKVLVTESRKRKRGEYFNYDDGIRAKIARYAIDNGVTKASRHFSADLAHNVSKTTVRSMRDQYVKVKKQLGCDTTTLARSPRGAPTLLGAYDIELQDYIRQVRVQGGVVNVRTVTAAAEGIVLKNDRKKLQRFGGHITIEKSLARSVLRRMGFVKRKGTSANQVSADRLPVNSGRVPGQGEQGRK